MALVVPESSIGVCLWEIDGKYLSDGDGGFLSLEGVIGDRRVEEKMRKAARYWTGIEVGQPKWLPGARKISDDEYDDQKERLLDGKIPDVVDEVRQAMQRGKK